MNIENYNFEQLYRLTSVENQMQVTEAYHKMLRRTWEEFNPGQFFLVSVAEQTYPCRVIAAPWRRVLDFIRDPEHKQRLRDLADISTPERHSPAKPIREVKFDDRAGNFVRAFRLASLLESWVAECGVDCRVIQNPNGFSLYGHTDEIGVAILYRKSGPTVGWLRNEWDGTAESFFQAFPWIPKNAMEARVNPLRKPVYTPDVQKEIEDIVCR